MRIRSQELKLKLIDDFPGPLFDQFTRFVFDNLVNLQDLNLDNNNQLIDLPDSFVNLLQT